MSGVGSNRSSIEAASTLRRGLLPLILLITWFSACTQQSSGPVATQAAATPALSAPAENTGITPASPFPAPTIRGPYVPGELIVKFRPLTAKTRADSLLRLASVRFARDYRTIPGLMRVSLAPETSVQTARATLEALPEVEYAEPNYYVDPHVIPNDEWFHIQSNLHTLGNGDVPPDTDIDAPEAWDITTGSEDIVVAVLDTGIFPTHEDLAANIFRNEIECDADGVDDDANGYVDDCNGIDAYENDSDPTDTTIHGSHVAGILGAVSDNSVGIAGVAWKVRILPCRFIDFNNGGTIADAVQCFDYVSAMKDRGVNIVATNNSWGSLYGSRALHDAIGMQRARGILTIASAGNDDLNNDREPVYPCNVDHSNVICVGSTGYFHRSSGFSNYGVTTVHLSAPGEDVYSAVSNNATLHEYDYLSGTSMSAPAVTGAAVLLAAQDPTRDWIAIKNLLLAGTDFLDETPRRSITSGRLNLPGSLQCSNRTVQRRLKPHFLEHILPPGGVVPLRAMHINCDQPNGNILINVSPSGEVIVLADSGVGDDEVANDGVYSGSWTAPASGNHQLRFQDPIGDVVNVRVDPFIKPGFPVTGAESGWFTGFWDSPAHQVLVGNIDDDPEQEIVFGSVSAGPLFAWNHDGSLIPGWPIDDYSGMPYVGLGEFDGNPAWSEVANNRLFSNGTILYTGAGQRMPGWPHAGFMLFPPATADLDGDGLDEIILYPARRADGSIFNPLTEVPVFGPRSGGIGLPASIAVGDLDFDGLPEMVVGRDAGVWASNAADLLAGFPAPYPPGSTVQSRQVVPVISDVDGDGSPEIIVVTVTDDDDLVGRVHVFSNRGVHKRMLTVTMEEWPTLAPVLADLDGDGIPEILVQTAQRIHAWKGNGTPLPGWPVFLGADAHSLLSTPVVGDINGDGLPDVMTTAQNTSAPFSGRIYLYHRDGRAHDGYPQALPSYRMGMAAAIADLDLDGRNELIVAPTSVPGTSASIYAYDYNGGNASGPIEWGQWMEGAHNRGFYEPGKNLPNHAFVAVQSHGHGNVTKDGGGISCGSDCVERVAKGAQVTLRAEALPGGTFDSWRGACAGQGNPCVLTVNGYAPVAANFHSPLAARRMTVTRTGTGTGTVTSNPAGINCGNNCAADFLPDAVVKLMPTAAANSEFRGWNGDCNSFAVTCTVTMDRSKNVGAIFDLKPLVSVAATGGGRVTSSPAGIDCGPNCSFGFPFDEHVTITATADVGSAFVGWGGACAATGSHPACVLQFLDGPRNVTALFSGEPALTIQMAGGGSGRVTSSPGGIDCGGTCSANYAAGTVVTITANPASGSAFTGWSGSCTGSQRTCTLTLNASATVMAIFDMSGPSGGGGGGGGGGGALGWLSLALLWLLAPVGQQKCIRVWRSL